MRDTFIGALRNVVYPVSIVSSSGEDKKYAITVSSVTSVSIDPPSLLVCINKNSSFIDSIANDSFMNINFLNPRQKDIASICSSKDKASQRFDNEQWTEDQNGTPYLKKSEAVMFCKVVKFIPHATHFIVILAVDKVINNNDSIPNPLLYCDGKYFNI